MQNFTPIKSIIFIAIAGVIVYFYAIPKVSVIGNNQDQQEIFMAELSKVSGANVDLNEKLSQRDAISPADRQRLMNFLPSELDEVKVLKDLEFLINSSGLTLEEISFKGAQETKSESTESEFEMPIKTYTNHQFVIKFSATYNQMKSVLLALENNSYLLQVAELELMPNEDELISASLTIDVFSRAVSSNSDGSEPNFSNE